MTEVGIATYDILGVPIAATSLARTSVIIEKWANDDIGRFISVRDVANLMMVITDPDLAPIHQEAAMIIPDGMPLVVIGKLHGETVERTCGPDLMDFVCRRSQDSGLRHYFYGGKEGVAEKLAGVLLQRYPGLQVAGYECPPFRPLTEEEDEAVIERIKASNADVVWIGISSPKQDVWMLNHYRRLPQTLIGIGAAFDFHTGEVKRAPKWVQKSGFEWLHRLSSEPKRLWRRYLILVPYFIWRLLVNSLTHGRRSKH